MKLTNKGQIALHHMVEQAVDREIDFHHMVDLPDDPFEAAAHVVAKSAPGKGQLALAWAQALTIIGAHGQQCNARQSHVVLRVLGLRSGHLSSAEFATWLRGHCESATAPAERLPKPSVVRVKPREEMPPTVDSTKETVPDAPAVPFSVAQEPPKLASGHVWDSGHRGAISLTYDGGQLCHLEHALPYLNAIGLKATFFVDGADFVTHVNRWKEARTWGHEIANGCIVKAAYADGRLPAWSTQMIQDEIIETQSMFREVLGDEPTSFAFPWGYPQCQGGADYRHVAQARFLYARSGLEGYNDPSILSLKYLRCVRCDGYDANDLIRLAENGLARGNWVIMAFDGVGSGERSIDHSTHQTFLRWVHQNRHEVLIETVHNMGKMLANNVPV